MPWNKKTQTNLALSRWERARKKKAEPFPLDELNGHTFEGLDLTGADFAGATLKHTIFSGCCLNSCSFRSCVLHECIIIEGSMLATRLEAADLSTSFIEGVDITNCFVNEKTQMPKDMNWITQLLYRGIGRDLQVSLWADYPNTGTLQEKEEYLTFAELKYGSTL